jgi:hypothetical protein
VIFDSAAFLQSLSAAAVPLGTAIIVIVNLHHYFIDAVIWKIREPKVRHALFGHLA